MKTYKKKNVLTRAIISNMDVEPRADIVHITNIRSNDYFILCTDGLLEALNGDGRQYSKANLENIVKQFHSLDGKAIANKIKDDVKKFCGTAALHDDQSLLVIKIK